MVLIVRGELRLTAGKAAVQAAHAAVMLVQRAGSRDEGALSAWLAEGQKKVALAVGTLAEMEAIERRARGAGIPTVWVDDAGFRGSAGHAHLPRARSGPGDLPRPHHRLVAPPVGPPGDRRTNGRSDR